MLGCWLVTPMIECSADSWHLFLTINPRSVWGRSATTWQPHWLLSLLESSSQSPSGGCFYFLPVLQDNLFRPGLANTEEQLHHREGRNTTTTDTLLDLLTNCFPPNLVQVEYTVSFTRNNSQKICVPKSCRINRRFAVFSAFISSRFWNDHRWVLGGETVEVLGGQTYSVFLEGDSKEQQFRYCREHKTTIFYMSVNLVVEDEI